MTDQRELDRILDAFFVVGTDELADRVIDLALEEIDQTRQRHPGRMLRRFSTMKTPTRVAVAAVIGVVALGGALYLVRPDRSSIGPSATPAASPSPAVTASPGPSASPSGPSWTMTGGLIAPREGHTAIMLPDGRVLVIGGSSAAEAEQYDPASGSWVTLAGDDFGAFPTLLRDGTLLVVGSRGAAARYDPDSGTTTATGHMVTVPPAIVPPADHVAWSGPSSATLLGDGTVLLAGVESSEVYDPTDGTWTATGKMLADRSVTALLADGRVLAIGGAEGSAEIYDPASGVWTATGNMRQERNNLTATLLADGRVLAVGSVGYPGPVPAVVGELFDPVSGTWTTTGPLVTPRINHTATLLPDGKVLVLGGSTGSGPSAELFDPETGSWTATANMLAPRSGHSATLLSDGRVLVVGGIIETAGGGRAIVSSAELYDPGSGS